MEKICGANIVFPDKTKYVIAYSDNLVDLVKKMLDKDRKKRLGSAGGKEGFKEILDHPWFSDLDLKAIQAKTMKPPFMPNFGK